MPWRNGGEQGELVGERGDSGVGLKALQFRVHMRA